MPELTGQEKQTTTSGALAKLRQVVEGVESSSPKLDSWDTNGLIPGILWRVCLAHDSTSASHGFLTLHLEAIWLWGKTNSKNGTVANRNRTQICCPIPGDFAPSADGTVRVSPWVSGC